MNISRFAFSFIALTIILYGNWALAGEIVGSKDEGKWIAGNFYNKNIFCTRAWLCTPGVDVLHGIDTKVVTTENVSTEGVCNAADGPADSCNDCSAPKPTESCQYWLERK